MISQTLLRPSSLDPRFWGHLCRVKRWLLPLSQTSRRGGPLSGERLQRNMRAFASFPTVEILARPSERIRIIQTPTSDSNRQFCPFQHFRLIEFLLTAVGFPALTCATTFWHGACLTESCDASDHF